MGYGCAINTYCDCLIDKICLLSLFSRLKLESDNHQSRLVQLDKLRGGLEVQCNALQLQMADTQAELENKKKFVNCLVITMGRVKELNLNKLLLKKPEPKRKLRLKHIMIVGCLLTDF